MINCPGCKFSEYFRQKRAVECRTRPRPRPRPRPGGRFSDDPVTYRARKVILETMIRLS